MGFGVIRSAIAVRQGCRSFGPGTPALETDNERVPVRSEEIHDGGMLVVHACPHIQWNQFGPGANRGGRGPSGAPFGPVHSVIRSAMAAWFNRGSYCSHSRSVVPHRWQNP